MSDKVEKLGKELELTPEQWADFHKFYMSYWEQYGGKFMFRCDKLSDNETDEQAEQRERELLERKFLEWLEIMEIRKL
ncbi:hypothetical protein NMV21_11340, partial [Pasteurella multocida]|nr:hypothetical protein [Pasteurella multocida]